MVQKKRYAQRQAGGQQTAREAVMAHETAFVGHQAGAVAAPQGEPIISQGESEPGRQVPALRRVRPGDLITAEYINDLVAAIQDLQSRVDDLEAPEDDYDDIAAAAA